MAPPSRARELTSEEVRKSFVEVTARLDEAGMKGPERLELLRRQAQLSDLRAALLDRR